MESSSDSEAALLAVLQEGCKRFDFEFGIISRITGDDYEVLAGIAELPFFQAGDHFALPDTFCSEVIRSSKTVCYNQVGDIGALQNHPAYRNMKLESYIGAPIRIGHDIVGTINFSSLVAREVNFTREEIAYAESLAARLADEFGDVFAS